MALAASIAFALTLLPAHGAEAEEALQPAASPSATALLEEVARAKSLELPGMPRAHHITVTLLGEEETVVEASLGALVKQDRNRSRILKVEVRVGDPTFDSGNFLGAVEEPIAVAPAPLEADTHALKRTLWLLADRAYKNATETYEAKRAHVESMAQEEEPLEDFVSAPVERFRGAQGATVPPTASYVDLARSVSEVFAAHPDVHRSFVRIVARTRTRTLVDSATTAIEDASSLLRVEMVARTQADDGMVIADHEVLAYPSFDAMPPLEQLKARAEELASRLERMRVAPVVKDYAGPVLFEGRAGAQLLRFLLADELSATPSPKPGMGSEGTSESFLSSRVGWRVLPLGFDVTDDPNVSRVIGLPVIGGYLYDDEGVRAQAVDVVKDGSLQSLLSSRTPSKAVQQSNGHGRAGVMGHARGRAANLWVRARTGLSSAAMRDRLIATARKEGLDHGIVVVGLDEPSLTDRAMAVQAPGSGGTVLPRPTEVYRMDGKGNLELVRGASLHALRPRDLRHVLAAGRDPFVHSYMASASPYRASESFGGEIPTSVVAPSLLLPDVDVMGPTAPYPLPPIVPQP